MAKYYKDVPKEYLENLMYRRTLRLYAQKSDRHKRAFVTMCREDPVYFFIAWAFLYEPRPMIGPNGREKSKIIPFIPWAHQIPVIQAIHANLGHEDIGVEKSRGEGMSWIIVLMAVWYWLFKPLSAVGLVSRNENAVDNPDDPDSMLWKFDRELEWLPKWLSGIKGVDYKRDLSRHLVKNLRND